MSLAGQNNDLTDKNYLQSCMYMYMYTINAKMRGTLGFSVFAISSIFIVIWSNFLAVLIANFSGLFGFPGRLIATFQFGQIFMAVSQFPT